MKILIITLAFLVLTAVIGPQVVFIVDETELAVVTQFGVIKKVETTAGLKIKTPFVQQVNLFDKRLLRVDLPEDELPDVDKQFLNIDAYVRYRIGHTENGQAIVTADDVKRFRESLRTEASASSRITEIVASAMKQEIGKRSREEVIGARQEIVDGLEVTISTNSRQEILDAVQISAEKIIQDANDGRGLGITLVDVRIKRADFPSETQNAIFDRMRAERLELAAGFRSEGGRERARIEAKVDKDVAVILSVAEKEANILRGEGEAEAIRILAASLEQDPEFFSFRRSLEAYKNFLSQNTTVILSSDSELFRFLDKTN
jgi:membrane protease subunit HflC